MIAEDIVGRKLKPLLEQGVIVLHGSVGGSFGDVSGSNDKARLGHLAADLLVPIRAVHGVHGTDNGLKR